jgi:phosphoglycolate phosphatase-like HAD superfamily hydrolase
MNKKWIVLFDWDGTLINSHEIKIHNAAVVFHEILGANPEKIAAVYRHYSGIPRRQLFEVICAENGLSPLEDVQFQLLSQRFSEANLAALSNPNIDGLVPPDTPQALSTLSQLGYPLYISSSSLTDEIRKIAVALGLERFFYDILGSSPGLNKGRDHVDYAMKQQNASRSQVVFVGDEPIDIALGKSAGVLTFVKTGTHPADILAKAGPDGIISSLCELPDLLLKRSPSDSIFGAL